MTLLVFEFLLLSLFSLQATATSLPASLTVNLCDNERDVTITARTCTNELTVPVRCYPNCRTILVQRQYLRDSEIRMCAFQRCCHARRTIRSMRLSWLPALSCY